jgi:hypothetical protein
VPDGALAAAGQFFSTGPSNLRFPESARTYSVFHNFIQVFADRWSFCAAHQAEMDKGTASRFIFWPTAEFIAGQEVCVGQLQSGSQFQAAANWVWQRRGVPGLPGGR